MALPRNPMTVEQHQARLPEALKRLWDVVAMDAEGGADRPGLCPANVFDFPDGLRLIVGRERQAEPNGEVVHVSASVFKGSSLWHAILAEGPAFLGLRKAVESRFQAIGGPTIYFAFLSPRAGIPHWFDRVLLIDELREVGREKVYPCT